MGYNPTDTELKAIKQKTKDIFIKVELLNKNYKIIDSFTANLINDSINIDSKSKQRRTYNCTLHITDYSFLIGNDKKIWIDKYIRVYYGMNTLRSNELIWFLIGTFTHVDANYVYSATERTLSLSCLDLMADYDGTKNGVIGGYSLTIPAGEDIRNSVLALVKKAGITKYRIEDIKKPIPYDLEHSDSITYCDVWTEVCELYDSWEFFFDIDGTFVWQQIPTGYSEPVVLDDYFFKELTITENVNSSFKGIYNVTEIWGKILELSNGDRYAELSTYSNNVYSITLKGVTALTDLNDLDQIGIKICSSNSLNAKVSINGLEAIPIVNDDGTYIVTDRLKADTTYVLMFRKTLNGEIKNCLCLLGQYQAYGIYKEENPECPFSVANLGYKITQRLNYEKLYSDDLCYNQAEYLSYQSTAMRDTISLSMIIVPFMDVNQKIKYTSNITGETAQYIVQNISWSTLDGIMSVTLYRFLESFCYVKNKEKTTGRRNLNGYCN